MYKMFETNRKMKDMHQWRENIDHLIMGNGEIQDFFEKRTDFSSGEEYLLKQIFDAASAEEKRVLSKLLKKMVQKDRH